MPRVPSYFLSPSAHVQWLFTVPCNSNDADNAIVCCPSVCPFVCLFDWCDVDIQWSYKFNYVKSYFAYK